MLEHVRYYKTILKGVEETVFDKESFSYTLGFNLKGGLVSQVKLYIRLFARTPDITLFFKVINDAQIQSVAINSFSTWNSMAISKRGIGFKGFTLMVGFDLDDDEEIIGYGGRMPTRDGDIFQASVFKQISSSLQLDKRTYRYEPKSSIKDFGCDLKFCTDTVETQYGAGEDKARKFCLCPEFNKDNIPRLSSNLRKNLKGKDLKFHRELMKAYPNLTLVNTGFDREGDAKVYYHNFLSQNKIGGYL